jgi:7,8-dihydroneopterin aldolase/epimerase/oxygenase
MNENAMDAYLKTDCRRLFLRGHTRLVRIGVHEFEQQAPQRLVFDIDLHVPLALSTPVQDRLTEVVDYDFVRKTVADLCDAGQIGLQETLCDRLLDALLAHPQVHAVKVRTYKPDVYPDCDAVGVERFAMKQRFL